MSIKNLYVNLVIQYLESNNIYKMIKYGLIKYIKHEKMIDILIQ